jgi:hypothetical protein
MEVAARENIPDLYGIMAFILPAIKRAVLRSYKLQVSFDAFKLSPL